MKPVLGEDADRLLRALYDAERAGVRLRIKDFIPPWTVDRLNAAAAELAKHGLIENDPEVKKRGALA